MYKRQTEDPLELALVRAEAEQSVENIEAAGYAEMLDSARSMGRMVASLSLEEASNRVETTPSERPLHRTRLFCRTNQRIPGASLKLPRLS